MAKLIDRLPDAYKDFIEFQELFNSLDPEFDKINDQLYYWTQNLFPKTAGDEGLSRYEDLLNLYPKKSDSIEYRRQRVIAKFSEQFPYTEIQLRKILANLLGWDGFSLRIEDLELWLAISIKNRTSINTIAEILMDMVPENILIHLAQDAKARAEVIVSSFYKGIQEIVILPRQTRAIETVQSVVCSSINRDKNEITVLPWQRQKQDFNLSLLGLGSFFCGEITILPRQIKNNRQKLERLVASLTKTHEEITIPARRF